jgi:restriction endonuclease Mrr
MNNLIIDLEKHRTKNSKVFTGRDRGITVREDSKIDIINDENNSIVIQIPKDIMSINPSFLEELLVNVVNKLGKEGFYKKFLFKTESTRYNIEVDLEEAIERILRNENALAKR